MGGIVGETFVSSGSSQPLHSQPPSEYKKTVHVATIWELIISTQQHSTAQPHTSLLLPTVLPSTDKMVATVSKIAAVLGMTAIASGMP